MYKILSILFNDSPDASHILRELCPNCDILELADEKDVLQAIKSHRPDLVLLNATNKSNSCSVPSLIREVRNDKETRNTSIAALTHENIRPAEGEELIDAGANIIIPTPSDPRLWSFKLEKILNASERYKLRAPVEIITWTKIKGVGDYVQGTAFNINLGGMLLQLPVVLAPDTKIDIIFSLPGDSQPLSCVGRIVWQDKTNNYCGVEFLAQRGDSRERLVQFLDTVFSEPNKSASKNDDERLIKVDHHQWERLLRTNEARKDAILNSAFDCIIAVDSEDKILEFNEVAEETFGYQKTDILLRRKLDKLLSESICLALRKCLFDFVEEKNTDTCLLLESNAKRSDGTEFPVEIRAKAIYIEREALLIINIKDVTDRKKMMEEYKRASQLAALGEVAAGVAHEINNPINGVINYAQMLISKNDKNDNSNKILERIVKEGNRISNIVHNLLNFAQKDRDDFSFLDLMDIVVEPLNLSAQVFRKNGIYVDVGIPDDLPKIYGNRMQLEQVVLNLLSNAHHALNKKFPGSSNEKFIVIDATSFINKNGGNVQLRIKDSGCGIPKDHIEKIFNPFFTTKEAGLGTGLGLTLSHDILENHGAKISVDSQVGKFTMLKITFPVKTE